MAAYGATAGGSYSYDPKSRQLMLDGQQVGQGAPGIYNENVAKQYAADPRTQIANALQSAGANGAPVAGGEYAILDGIARVLSGAAGGYVQKQQRNKYEGVDAKTSDMLRRTAGGTSAPAQALAVTQPQAQPQVGQGGPAVNPTIPPVAPGGGRKVRSADFGSYRSSAYDPIEQSLEQKYNLPAGLLTSIRTKGERSNADQVSSAGARTVYQFTPETRALFIKNKGIDPWSSPQAAAEAAAIHLSDSFKRGNDVAGAVGEYIGGPDRKRWGPTTRDYIERVVGGSSTGSRRAQPTQATEVASLDPVDVPSVPDPVGRPDRPGERASPKSRRLEVAMQLLGMGQGNLGAMMARPFLEQGLEDEQKGAENAVESERSLDRIGFQSDMQNFQGQQNAQFDSRLQAQRDAINYNRTVERDNVHAQRQSAIAQQQRGYEVEDREDAQSFQTSQLQTRNAAAEALAAAKARYARDESSARSLETPAGQKWIADNQQTLQRASETLTSLDALESIANRMSTGGVENSGFAASVKEKYNSDFATMQTTARDLVLSKMGGSLGTAISDADRKFVEGIVAANGSVPKASLTRFIGIMRGSARRQRDYSEGVLKSRVNNYSRQFQRAWLQYQKEVPVSVNGEPLRDFPSFDDWYEQTGAGKRLGVR